jgi:hypothetical protein
MIETNSEENHYYLGLTKSPIDERDYKYGEKCEVLSLENINIKYPKTIDYRNQMRSIRNQGNRSTCVAFACSSMKEWQEKEIIGKTQYMSPEFIYENKNDKNEPGMHLREAMDILLKLGICGEDIYPYSDSNPKTIPPSIYEIASNFKIQSYAQINSQEELQTALVNNGPCLVAFPCYNHSSNFWKQNDGDSLLGGHCVLIVGYNEKGYIIRNSWGITWGDFGYTYYLYNEWGEHWEIWSSIDSFTDPTLVPQKLKQDKCCRFM